MSPWWSTLPPDSSVSSGKQHPSKRVKKGTAIYWWWLCNVIWSKKLIFVSLSLDPPWCMLKILCNSIDMTINIRQIHFQICRWKLGGDTLKNKQKNTDLNVMMSAFNAGMLYETTHWSGFPAQGLGGGGWTGQTPDFQPGNQGLDPLWRNKQWWLF